VYTQSRMAKPTTTKSRTLGWLISVQSPTADHRPLYATIAKTNEHAKALVSAYSATTIVDTIRFERALTDGEITRLGLKPGEVKLYAT
jgi:hypothetical protein